jgi:alpha-ketoglutaric semialdehyde dehydrogenase
MMEQVLNLVDGTWVEARNGGWLQRHDPAEQDDLVVEYPAMTASDVDGAVDAATRGLARWCHTPILERGRVLSTAGDILRERAAIVVADIVREMGKTQAEAAGEVAASAAFFDYYAGLARSAQGEVVADRRGGVTAYTQRVPVGVVVLITPWNDPLLTPARKLAPALLMGNGVVLKPAPETPLSALHLASALFDAGLADGALNLVTGRNLDVGPPLLEHAAVDAVSFTGSTAVGRELERMLAGRGVRLQTELGGKNAVLVMPDADLDLVEDAIITAAFGQAGQRCTATSRAVVHAEVHDALVERLVKRATGLRLGPGLDERSEMGPVVSGRHLERILSAIRIGEQDGATLVAGGRRADQPPLDRGWFCEPTIFVDVREESALWQEEIFGPVLAVRSVDGLDEGIATLNASRYGLSAGIFTRDLMAAYRFVEAVDTGQVAVNLPTSGWDVHVPFGGTKDSGSAFKEHGVEGLRFYSDVKSVALSRG